MAATVQGCRLLIGKHKVRRYGINSVYVLWKWLFPYCLRVLIRNGESSIKVLGFLKCSEIRRFRVQIPVLKLLGPWARPSTLGQMFPVSQMLNLRAANQTKMVRSAQRHITSSRVLNLWALLTNLYYRIRTTQKVLLLKSRPCRSVVRKTVLIRCFPFTVTLSNSFCMFLFCHLLNACCRLPGMPDSTGQTASNKKYLTF